jgi:protein-tyrosine phosphatase
LFNHLATETGLKWSADSRGLMVGNWGYLGAISDSTVQHLQCRGVPINGQHRAPEALTLDDLEDADLVVAVKECEHREEVRRQYPDWERRVEYWDVDDLDCATPDESLPYLEDLVRALIDRLGNGSSEARGPST